MDAYCTLSAERRVIIEMMNINDAKAVIKGLQEKPFICSENAIETDNGFVIKRIPKKYSNADKIRSMNDEELAEFLTGLNEHCLAGIGKIDCSSCNGYCEDNCRRMTRKWLQSEAE